MNLIDVLVRQYMQPLLKPLGFERKNRVFFRYSADRDVASIEVRSVPGGRACYVIYGVVSNGDVMFYLASGGSMPSAVVAESGGLFSSRLKVPGAMGIGDDWSFDPQDPESIAVCGQKLVDTMREEMLPLLDRVSTRAGMLDFLGSIEPIRGRWAARTREGTRMNFRIDSGPPREVLAELEDRISQLPRAGAYHEWARRYLAERIAAEEA